MPNPTRTAEPRDETSFLATRNGVFYPKGHLVLGVPEGNADTLAGQIADTGIARGDILVMTPARMIDVLDESEAGAGIAARIVGAELKAIEIMRQLAEDGDAFIIVKAEDDDARERILMAARRHPVKKALHYRTLAFEEVDIGREEIPGESPYGMNEIPRNKDSDAQPKPRR